MSTPTSVSGLEDAVRIEVFTDAPHENEVLNAFRKAGAKGYTVTRGMQGWGERGRRSGGDVSDALSTCAIVCVCDQPTADAMAAALASVLKRHGGEATFTPTKRLAH